MKNRKKYPHLTVVHPRQPLYPNAADHRYFQQKALDIVTGLVSCMGFVSAMVFLATMS